MTQTWACSIAERATVEDWTRAALRAALSSHECSDHIVGAVGLSSAGLNLRLGSTCALRLGRDRFRAEQVRVLDDRADGRQ